MAIDGLLQMPISGGKVRFLAKEKITWGREISPDGFRCLRRVTGRRLETMALESDSVRSNLELLELHLSSASHHIS